MTSALIIDADASAAQSIERALVPYGVNCTRTDDVQDALNVARATTPDVIFLRVELPGSSGFSLCNKFRRNEETQYIPLMMYASNTPDDVLAQHRGLRTRADEYVRIPFDEGSFVAAVRSLVPLPNEPTHVAGADPSPMADLDEGFEEMEVDTSEVDVDEPSPDASAPVVDFEHESNDIGAATDAAFDTLLIDDEPPPLPPVETHAEPEPAEDHASASHEPADHEAVAVADVGPRSSRSVEDSGTHEAASESSPSSRREALAMRAQLVAKDRELAGLREELEARERALSEARERARRSEAGLAEAEARLIGLEEENVTAAESAEAANRDKQTILKREEGLKNRLELAQKKIKEGEDEIERLTAAMAEADAQRGDLRAQADTANSKLAIVEESLQEAQVELELLRARSGQESQVLESKLEGALADLTAANGKLAETIATVGDLERELQALRDKTAADTEKLAELEEDLVAARAELDGVRVGYTQKLEEAGAQTEAALQTLRSELESARTRADQAAQTIDAYEGEIARLRSEHGELSAAREQATERIGALERELEALRSQVDASTDRKRKVQQALAVALRVLD